MVRLFFLRLQQLTIVLCAIAIFSGCDQPVANKAVSNPAPWMGIPSAVNQVIVSLHDGTGWLLNKSEVAVKKSGEVRLVETSERECLADFLISVRFGGETFETTAKDVPCDKDGIPTEAAVDRLRTSVEDIKSKMKRLQK
ncbi:MAG: hypothetical protein NTY15_18930 [Planctomycetota bacterium]|nr:hypothetical protein [Planctomycetota bacterium]